ncbi:hypothetical protein CsSME_00020317 [Camellia sinensis var. sinensis]
MKIISHMQVQFIEALMSARVGRVTLECQSHAYIEHCKWTKKIRKKPKRNGRAQGRIHQQNTVSNILVKIF